MKTFNQLYPQIVAFENLLLAVRNCERGKRYRHDAGSFRTNREREILQLQRALKAQCYHPGEYRERVIHRPKRRLISAAPYRDRVVHHALCQVVMPLFERRMIQDLYSNRDDMGTHAAIRRCRHFTRRYRYVLKCDIGKFYPSIDLEILKQIVRRTIRCRETLWLMDTLIDHSNPQEAVCALFPGDDLAEAASRRIGLPIGNLTSQWFGGIYLTPFDHWVKQELRCGGYLRYVDDFLLFSDDKAELRDWRAAIVDRLAQVRLRLHAGKSRTHRVADGVTFLGQRIWPHQQRLCRPNVASARRRLRWNVRQYLDGTLSKEALTARWMSWRGHALQADTAGLVAQLRRDLVEPLGPAGTQPPANACCGAARGTTTRTTCAVRTATTTIR